jgi:hypothetical protein
MKMLANDIERELQSGEWSEQLRATIDRVIHRD